MRVLITETTWDSMVAANDLALAGFLVTRAGDAVEASEYAALADHDLYLIDDDLPDMQMFDLVRRLRGYKPLAAICLLSAPRLWKQNLKAFELGIDDMIVKGTPPKEVVARVHAVARRRHGLASPVIEAGGLTIDLLQRRVLAGGRDVPLARLEYEVLEMLALRRGNVLSKDAIMGQLYGLDDAPDTKIITVYICQLRAKIAAAGGDPGIVETVRGRGYALFEPMPARQAA